MLAAFVEGLFFIYGWYSWQRYFLDLLARELVWVAGIVAALMSVSMILGNSLVGRFSTDASRRPGIIAINSFIRATVILAAGLLGTLTPPEARGVGVFTAVVALYLIFGLSFGISNPVRMALVNKMIGDQEAAIRHAQRVLEITQGEQEQRTDAIPQRAPADSASTRLRA